MYAFAGNEYGPRSPVAINMFVAKSETSACMLLNLSGRKLPPVSTFMLNDALNANVAGNLPNWGSGESVNIVAVNGVSLST